MERYNNDQRLAVIDFCEGAMALGVRQPSVYKLLQAARQNSPVLASHMGLQEKSGGQILEGLTEEQRAGVKALITRLYQEVRRRADDDEEPKSSRLTMRLSPDERRQITEICQATGESASDMIRRLIHMEYKIGAG